jgi:hypothetical protein
MGLTGHEVPSQSFITPLELQIIQLVLAGTSLT